MKAKKKYVYLLFDGRYIADPDRATCFEMCESLREARGSKDDYGTDTVIVKYLDDNSGTLQNPEIIY